MGAPVLMIPGPIELSPRVLEAAATAPPSHLAPSFVEAYGRSLERMRHVWRAADDSQPMVVAGGGTLAMEMAAWNLLDPGDRVLVVSTGYFSERMAEMLRRAGADVHEIVALPGESPSPHAIGAALSDAHAAGQPFRAVFATHVDTSTGVRVDARAIAAHAREYGALMVFDAVCATGGERLDMAAWGADVVLTASQKALGGPPGLALLVASPDALEARARLRRLPPLALDWHAWTPIWRAYEERRPAYFSTPATSLVLALDAALDEIVSPSAVDAPADRAMATRFAQHERTADAFRAAWAALGLSLVPARPELAANTLSAIRYPEGVDARLVGAIGQRGVVVAGGLHPAIRDQYFRVGHMGHVISREPDLLRTVRAVGEALGELGHEAPVEEAAAAFLDRYAAP